MCVLYTDSNSVKEIQPEGVAAEDRTVPQVGLDLQYRCKRSTAWGRGGGGLFSGLGQLFGSLGVTIHTQSFRPLKL